MATVFLRSLWNLANTYIGQISLTSSRFYLIKYMHSDLIGDFDLISNPDVIFFVLDLKLGTHVVLNLL